MNSTSLVSETSSSSTRHQHPNVKEEIDADSVEMVIKVKDEGEEVKVECEDIEVDLKVEDEEKPTVCQCEECGPGCCRRVDRCTRVMTGCSSQAIKKEEREGDDEQSDEPRRDKKAKRIEILVKEEVKEEEDELNVAGHLTQRCGSGSVDSVIIKFEDEEVPCPCEECGMIKEEEGGEEVKVEEEGANEVAIDVGESSDKETVVEDESEDGEDWLASTESSLGSSSEEEEETENGSTEVGQESIETGPSTAPLEVGPVAGADAKQVRTAKGSKRRPSPQCQKMVTSLERHLLTHTGERSHICDQCGRVFAQKAHLKGHLKIHSGEKAFSCQQCGKCFTQKKSLTVHLKRHNGEKAHQCDQCSSAFVSSGDLTTHRRQKHSTERPYRCHFANCGKAFASQSNLYQHLKRHSGEKVHQCDQCSSAFVTKGELTTHRRQKHSTERPYRCHIANCDKAYANQSRLTTHLNYHNGVKKHRCGDCEMSFFTSGHLTSHRRHKHSTERPHRCPHSGCNYAAATKGDLTKHINSKKHRQ